MDVEEGCKFFGQLDSLTYGAPVLVSEVKCKAYRASDGIRQSLNMTMFSQVIPTRAPEPTDDIAGQSQEILEAFIEAGSSPSRRRALKRLLSEAENPSTPRCSVRRDLDMLKVKGACAGTDEKAAPPEDDHDEALPESDEDQEPKPEE